MVSSREVIDLAVSVLDAVEDANLRASQMFDALMHAAGPPAAAPANLDGEVLAAEVEPLVAALERHMERARAWRSAQFVVLESDDQGTSLTERETEALLLLARGLTAAATARRMGCSTSTTNKHLGNVYRKLGVSDRLGAVLEAQRRGLLETDVRDAQIPPARVDAAVAGVGGEHRARALPSSIAWQT